jgi:hypothetical protein
MMTLGQFAYALGAPTKWVQNAWAILGLGPIYGEAELWRMALVRLLERAMEVPLKRAYATAQAAMTHPIVPGKLMELRLIDEGALDVSVDWGRFSTAVLAGLSRARTQYQERRRGRPRNEPLQGIAAARAQGIDVGLLRASLRRSPADRLRTLDEDLAFVQSLRVVQ